MSYVNPDIDPNLDWTQPGRRPGREDPPGTGWDPINPTNPNIRPPAEWGVGENVPPGSTPPPDGAEDALAYLKGILQTYGLESLVDWAWQQLLDGRSSAEVIQNLRSTEEYQERFKALTYLRENGYPAMSESEVISWENSARQTAIAAGLPPGFYDSYNDFAELIGRGMSVNEYADRVNEGFLAISNAPAEVRQWFQSEYGPDGDTALAMVYMDPDKAWPVLRRETQMAQIGGSALRFGFSVGRDRAEQLARMNVTQEQAGQGFAQLYSTRRLFDESITETEDLTPEDQGVDLLFDVGGMGAEKVRKRAEERKNLTSGGGGVTVGRRGATGLGTGSGT